VEIVTTGNGPTIVGAGPASPPEDIARDGPVPGRGYRGRGTYADPKTCARSRAPSRHEKDGPVPVCRPRADNMHRNGATGAPNENDVVAAPRPELRQPTPPRAIQIGAK